MKIKRLITGMLATNTYILSKKEECLVIDPGDDLNLIKNYLNEHKLKVLAILLTHGHFDHIGSAQDLAKDESCEIYISELDAELLENPMKNGSLTYLRKPIIIKDSLNYIKTKKFLKFNNFLLQVHYLPGHSKGSVGYLIEDNLFSGDTLFKGAYGRCDFYGGDESAMKESLIYLFSLPLNIVVYPGHGEKTTIGEERSNYL